MPSLLDIRRRIRAVKSTQQITKAMKMVAASRLRRAQERIVHARPFANQMMRVLHSLAARVDPAAHPLLDERTTARAKGRILLVVVTADRGLCGSFNTNIIKAAGTFVTEQSAQVALSLVGRRGRDFFVRRGFEVLYQRINLYTALKFDDAREIAKTAIDAFTEGQVDRVCLVYNEFKSIIVQRVVVEQVLPIERQAFDRPGGEPGRAAVPGGASPVGAETDYIYEPGPEELFAALLPIHVEVQIYRALLESNAAFYAAQMTAMDAASKNASEMIDSLTLRYNRARQAKITKELIEIVSGAEALA